MLSRLMPRPRMRKVPHEISHVTNDSISRPLRGDSRSLQPANILPGISAVPDVNIDFAFQANIKLACDHQNTRTHTHTFRVHCRYFNTIAAHYSETSPRTRATPEGGSPFSPEIASSSGARDLVLLVSVRVVTRANFWSP